MLGLSGGLGLSEEARWYDWTNGVPSKTVLTVFADERGRLLPCGQGTRTRVVLRAATGTGRALGLIGSALPARVPVGRASTAAGNPVPDRI